MTHAELLEEIKSGPLSGERIALPNYRDADGKKHEPSATLAEAFAGLRKAVKRRGQDATHIDPDQADAIAKLLLKPGTRTRQVPAPLSLAELRKTLSDEAFGRLFDHQHFTQLKSAIDEQNHALAIEWIGLFAARGLLSDSEREAAVVYCQRTQAVPCSRVEELGWQVNNSALFYEEVRAAKRLEG